MLLEKNKHCKCPNCGCMSFKDVSIVNVVVMKDEWNDEFLMPQKEIQKFKCIRCGKEFTANELYKYYSGE